MENLSEMVKNQKEDPRTFSAEELDLPQDAEATSENAETSTEGQSSTSIGITGLSIWLEENIDKFSNINIPRVAIRGVDPVKNMIIAVSDGSGEVDDEGHEKRDLVIFKNAASIPVLDLPGMDIQIYNNGFRITYDCGNDVFIKAYGVKLGLIVVFCNKINDKLIPYAITRVKKKDNEIECQTSELNTIIEKLSSPLDIEALHLRYKQSSKSENLSTNEDAINWLLERQAEVTDINHHLQIDNVIIGTLE